MLHDIFATVTRGLGVTFYHLLVKVHLRHALLKARGMTFLVVRRTCFENKSGLNSCKWTKPVSQPMVNILYIYYIYYIGQ